MTYQQIEEYVLTHYVDMTQADMARAVDRTSDTVRRILRKHGLTRKWDEACSKYLMSNLDKPDVEIADNLGFTAATVGKWRKKLTGGPTDGEQFVAAMRAWKPTPRPAEWRAR